jgi:solute carrier family 35 protein E1
MGKPQGENMNAMNLYAVMTILATILLFPFSMALEATKIVPSVQRLISTVRKYGLVITHECRFIRGCKVLNCTCTYVYTQGVAKPAATEMLLSGVFYYLYNEVAFLTLDAVAPVTHALGNTIKRVVIILTSVVVFGTKMTKTGALGSSIAIFGVLLYSLAKAKFK